jgi:hypothetical protein
MESNSLIWVLPCHINYTNHTDKLNNSYMLEAEKWEARWGFYPACGYVLQLQFGPTVRSFHGQGQDIKKTVGTLGAGCGHPHPAEKRPSTAAARAYQSHSGFWFRHSMALSGGPQQIFWAGDQYSKSFGAAWGLPYNAEAVTLL